MVRVFANGLGNKGSIPGQTTPKTQKIGLDNSLVNSILSYWSRVSGTIHGED